ncbi:MAG: chromosome partitioning protein ParB [Clostridiales bacterium GWB2_37_7]|nr:MAG: chromosome partitioning protein ParB [Clostridiales bacterium GWB2_37_7]
MKKSGLGKGLGALIRENEQEVNSSVTELKITELEANQNQPRRFFDDQALQELSGSIKEHGVVQPIIVRKLDDSYQIVAGERRWRAARLAGLKTVPVVIKDYSNVQVMEIALIENLQRQDLNSIEEALAYKSLLEEHNMTQENISEKIGKSRSAIANTLRLLNLPEEIKNMVVHGKISAGHARALLTIEDKKKQIEIAQKIIEQQLNVRDIEKLVMQKDVKEEKKKSSKDVEIIELEDRLKKALATKVNIIHKKNKGKIEIEYYSNDDLERILELLQK